MNRRKQVMRSAVVFAAVALSSTTLTGCHELYCNFVEGLTGVPLDCSHEAFPDLGDIPFPSLPPPPSLPTTSSTTLVDTSTTSTMPPDSTTPSTPTTSSSTTSSSTTSTSSTSSTSTTEPTAPTTSTTRPG